MKCLAIIAPRIVSLLTFLPLASMFFFGLGLRFLNHGYAKMLEILMDWSLCKAVRLIIRVWKMKVATSCWRNFPFNVNILLKKNSTLSQTSGGVFFLVHQVTVPTLIWDWRRQISAFVHTEGFETCVCWHIVRLAVVLVEIVRPWCTARSWCFVQQSCGSVARAQRLGPWGEV